MSEPSGVACAVCGKTIYLGGQSRPAGEAMCQPCHFADLKAKRMHGVSGYQKGCRCTECKQGIYAANRARYWKLKGEPARRTCMICGVAFTVGPTVGGRNNAAKTCSDECAKQRTLVAAWSGQTRRRGAFVEPVIPTEIFQRDKWRCHICRRKLSPKTRWPNRRTASLDHLVPISRGGLHEKANVKTCCLSCNSAKGNRGGNEQLLLIG